MKRRELFKRLAAGVAAAGLPVVAAEALELPKDAEWAMVVLSCSSPMSCATKEQVHRIWKKTVAGTAWEKVPMMITDGSVKVHVHVDGRALADEIMKRLTFGLRRANLSS